MRLMPATGSYPDFDAMLRMAAAEISAHPALQERDRSVAWVELDYMINVIANALI